MAVGAAEEAKLDALGELGRATTAYHEATPDRFEAARQEYERALHSFQDQQFRTKHRDREG